MNSRIKMKDAFIESDVKTYSRGDTIAGTIVQINDEEILVDIGYKSEGILPKRELSPFRKDGKVEEGEEIDVLVTYIDEEKGAVYASERQAEYEKRVASLNLAYREGKTVEGEIVDEVQGSGYHVNIDGVRAFLPGSHLGKTGLKEIKRLKGQKMMFKVLELSRGGRNLVVSHTAYLKDLDKEQINELFASLDKGAVIDGKIKSIVNFGIFVDIGGFEGLVHRSEISWKDLPVPPKTYKVGDTVRVKVIDFDQEKKKVSLSIKQLRPDPWKDAAVRYPAGTRVTGTVVSVTDFGAFVRLEEDIEGLVHLSELSWSFPSKPSEIVSEGDEVNVVVLNCNTKERKMSLSMRRAQRDPWCDVQKKYPKGTYVRGEVTKITAFGAFIKLEEGIEGLIHISELAWERIVRPSDMLKEGEIVEAKVLESNEEERRISLSLRALQADPWNEFLVQYGINDLVEGVVTEIKDFGAFVKITEHVDALIHVSEITEERIVTPHDYFAIGDKIKARIIGINDVKKQVRLSMRDLSLSSGKQKRPERINLNHEGHKDLTMRDLLGMIDEEAI
ncbi:S1 RNA-binding domain-containing protein [Candidatus Acetothermia bacterium]|nr:S1 RNA-binding domain-containing protein [Candidatus Acetothermia bacterium]MCI2427573.1 S1 RNA-binding domain-containing protein [Candidatus Acetothermia bacterium]MCI2428237.1 S1 RNA-binding domain-containing protein [Candidatus Acetothermia bacterium]